MKNLLINYGGAMILYIIFVLGLLFISSDFLSPKGVATTSSIGMVAFAN